MRTHITKIFTACVLATATPVLAQGSGELDYRTFCAMCHGDAGKGDGVMSGMLVNGAPDLTQLTVNNDGVFPMLQVIQTIDGRSGVRGHTSMMPMFGDIFNNAQANAGPYGAETFVRGRILSLAYYLESIQEE